MEMSDSLKDTVALGFPPESLFCFKPSQSGSTSLLALRGSPRDTGPSVWF